MAATVKSMLVGDILQLDTSHLCIFAALLDEPHDIGYETRGNGFPYYVFTA